MIGLCKHRSIPLWICGQFNHSTTGTLTSRFQPILQKASGMRAMVIGDAMIDRYLHGTTTRISPEAPVPVVALERAISKAGGAANVALNLAAWGCDTM